MLEGFSLNPSNILQNLAAGYMERTPTGQVGGAMGGDTSARFYNQLQNGLGSGLNEYIRICDEAYDRWKSTRLSGETPPAVVDFLGRVSAIAATTAMSFSSLAGNERLSARIWDLYDRTACHFNRVTNITQDGGVTTTTTRSNW